MDLESIENPLECAICLLPLSDNTNTLQCQHTYHKECIEKWLNIRNICPLCREPGPDRTDFYIGYTLNWIPFFKYKIYLRNSYLQIKYLCCVIEIPYSQIISLRMYTHIFEIKYFTEEATRKKTFIFKLRNNNILSNLFNSIKNKINNNIYVIQ